MKNLGKNREKQAPYNRHPKVRPPAQAREHGHNFLTGPNTSKPVLRGHKHSPPPPPPFWVPPATPMPWPPRRAELGRMSGHGAHGRLGRLVWKRGAKESGSRSVCASCVCDLHRCVSRRAAIFVGASSGVRPWRWNVVAHVFGAVHVSITVRLEPIRMARSKLSDITVWPASLLILSSTRLG